MPIRQIAVAADAETAYLPIGSPTRGWDAVHNAIEIGASGNRDSGGHVIVVATAHRTSPACSTCAASARRLQVVQCARQALQLGQRLVAAGLIRTVALAPTMPAILARLVVVRTFSGWSPVVEMEGHWPWKS
jgi:hypothetical protein